MTELELWKLAVPELDDDGLLNKICLDIATDMDQHNKIIDGILQKDSLFEYTPLFISPFNSTLRTLNGAILIV